MVLLGFTITVFEGKILQRLLIFDMNTSSCHVLGQGRMARVSIKLGVTCAGITIRVNSTVGTR